MEDITPKLLKKVQEDFQRGFNESKVIAELYAKVRDGTATYLEANDFAIEVGEILAGAYRRNISSAVLPDGKMYYNIANRILNPTMKQNHALITDVTNQVQKSLNEAANIGIRPITPKLNQDRIDGIINRLSSEDIFDEVAWILGEPVVNFSQSIVDDAIRDNAEFHGKAGMRPKIVRELAGGCCDWCREVADTYLYPDVPQKVYRRHQRCRCTVDYHPGNGKVQNIHSKQRRTEKAYDGLEVLKSIAIEQNYLPVKGSEILTLTDRKMGGMQLLKIDGYDEVYVQRGVSIKPKALYNINKNILSAINAYGGNTDYKPKVVVVDRNKLGNALGKYDCVQNVIYIVPDTGDKKLLSAFTTLDKTIKYGSTEYHECWHWMQAQRYGKVITDETRDTEYMPWLQRKCKKNIEALGITEYNVIEISDYAEDAFLNGRFDEVEAEYYVKKLLNEKR